MIGRCVCLKKMLKSYDYPLLAVYIIVCLFGLIMVYSSSMFVAINKGWDPATFYNSQLKKLDYIPIFTDFLCSVSI